MKLPTVGYGALRALRWLAGPLKVAGKTAIAVLTIATLILGFAKYRDDLNKGAQALSLDFEIPPLELNLNMEIALDPAQEARIIEAIRGQ